jgi:hypothetical protein
VSTGLISSPGHLGEYSAGGEGHPLIPHDGAQSYAHSSPDLSIPGAVLPSQHLAHEAVLPFLHGAPLPIQGEDTQRRRQKIKKPSVDGLDHMTQSLSQTAVSSGYKVNREGGEERIYMNVFPHLLLETTDASSTRDGSQVTLHPSTYVYRKYEKIYIDMRHGVQEPASREIISSHDSHAIIRFQVGVW